MLRKVDSTEAFSLEMLSGRRCQSPEKEASLEGKRGNALGPDNTEDPKLFKHRLNMPAQ